MRSTPFHDATTPFACFTTELAEKCYFWTPKQTGKLAPEAQMRPAQVAMCAVLVLDDLATYFTDHPSIMRLEFAALADFVLGVAHDNQQELRRHGIE